jgi:putative transposase
MSNRGCSVHSLLILLRPRRCRATSSSQTGRAFELAWVPGSARVPRMAPEFRRKQLPHLVPGWINPLSEAYFITINCIPRGRNQLATPGAWGALLEAIGFRESRGDWKWRLILAMPDHLHGIVTFEQRAYLSRDIASCKRWLATKAGFVWQDGYFEHRLRSRECAEEKAGYIRMNPVRAGLVENPDSWPYKRDWKSA